MHPSLESVWGGATRWTSHQFIATFDPWHQLGTFLPTAGFFFFRLMTTEMWWKKKIPVYLRLWNTEVLLYSGGQTCEPISRRRTFDQHVESAVIKDVSQRRAEPLLHHQLLCAGLEILNLGRRNIWHLCGGRLCNVPDNNTRVLGICNPISKASESPQPAIFFITNFFFFSWSVSVFFFFFLNPLGLMTVVRSYICCWYEILIMWPLFCTYLNLIFILEMHFSIQYFVRDAFFIFIASYGWISTMIHVLSG